MSPPRPVQYRILGPVELRVADQPRPLGGPRACNLLATLLLAAGSVVPVDRLSEVLWGDNPPRTAITALQGVISQLRRLLGPEGSSQLVFKAQGYALHVEKGDLDLHDFEHQAEAGRTELAAGNAERAAHLLGQALKMWRGEPLGGVTSDELLRSELPRLEELRLCTLEDRVDADLALGRHQELIPEMRVLVSHHSFRERLRGQLMLALYRAGRIAEALDCYRQGRQALAYELGLEPGGELQRLEQAILSRDPSLEPGLGRPSAVSSPVPAQLPPHAADYTGRGAELAVLRPLLRQAADEGRTAPVVVAISGKPGVGKTTLALRLGHELRDLFPGGQLYADLRGAGPAPAGPHDVLAGWLRDLGVEATAIPDDTASRARLFRSRVAGRRVLVVLDDAAREGQVRPLLPGSGGSAAVVTSRAALTGLEAAHFHELDVLSDEASLLLLSRIAGFDRLAAEPEAARATASACGYLPLALRVAGARLAAHRDWPVSRLAALLGDERRRLDVLVAGDLEVRASVALSYDALDVAAKRALRLLSVLDAPIFSSWMAAAAGGVDLQAVDVLLDRLVERRLLDLEGLDAIGQPRYRFHDVIRVFARERAAVEESSADRDAALSRVLQACLEMTEEAAGRLGATLIPPLTGPRLDGREPPVRRALEGAAADSMAWFTVERAGLVAMTLQALNELNGNPASWALVANLIPFFDLSSHWDDWRRTNEAALAAVHRSGDAEGVAAMLCGWGFLQNQLGDHQAAAASFRATLELADDDASSAAVAWFGVGETFWSRGRLVEAVPCYERSLALVAGVCERGEALVLYNLGVVLHEYGQTAQAFQRLARSLAIYERHGDGRGQAATLYGLGINCRDAGRTVDAERHFAQSRELYARAGDHRHEVYALYGLGTVHRARGELVAARMELEEAARRFRELGDRRGEAYACHGLGVTEYNAGRSTDAESHFAAALEIALSLGDDRAAVAARHGLGDVRLALGRTREAVDLLRHAVGSAQELGCRLHEDRAQTSLARAQEAAATAAEASSPSVVSTQWQTLS